MGAVPLALAKRIVGAGHAMERLIEALLALARADGNDLRPCEVDLSKLARDSLGELADRCPEREVEAVVQDGLLVQGDPTLMKLVIDNLVGNAWKFSQGCSTARIELGLLEQDGERIYFVRDDGPGFEPANALELFKPFHRLDTRVEGVGVGLAAVDRVIRKHGGRVWAEGRPGEGATFYFTLGPLPAA